MKGEPIRDPFRRAFSSAVQWFDCLKIKVQHSVDVAIEKAHQQLQTARAQSGTQSGAQGSPDLPEFPQTPKAPEASMPSLPSYLLPSETECARILQKRCPACFSGIMKGRSFAK